MKDGLYYSAIVVLIFILMIELPTSCKTTYELLVNGETDFIKNLWLSFTGSLLFIELIGLVITALLIAFIVVKK